MPQSKCFSFIMYSSFSDYGQKKHWLFCVKANLLFLVLILSQIFWHIISPSLLPLSVANFFCLYKIQAVDNISHIDQLYGYQFIINTCNSKFLPIILQLLSNLICNFKNSTGFLCIFLIWISFSVRFICILMDILFVVITKYLEYWKYWEIFLTF